MTEIDQLIEQVSIQSRELADMRSILNKQERYLSVQEAAEYIRRSVDYIRRRKNRIGFHKEGKDLTFKKSDLDKYMDSIYHIAATNIHIGSSENRKTTDNNDGGGQKRHAAI